MLTCRNCERLKVGGWQAVNCGNHDMYDPVVEARNRIALHALHTRIAARLKDCGFNQIGGRDVRMGAEDGNFIFEHAESLRFEQLDKLSAEFGTKRISWTKRTGYYDTAGYHATGEVEVWDAEGVGLSPVGPEAHLKSGRETLWGF